MILELFSEPDRVETNAKLFGVDFVMPKEGESVRVETPAGPYLVERLGLHLRLTFVRPMPSAVSSI